MRLFQFAALGLCALSLSALSASGAAAPQKVQSIGAGPGGQALGEARAGQDQTGQGQPAEPVPPRASSIVAGAEGQPDWVLVDPALNRSTWLLVAPIGRLHEQFPGELEALGLALRGSRGTAEAPQPTLDDQLGAFGALFDFEVGPRSTTLRLTTPAGDFARGVGLLSERLHSATLGPALIKPVLTRLATSGALEPDVERDLESALTRQLLGPDHALCRPLNLFALAASLGDFSAVHGRWRAALAGGQHAVGMASEDDQAMALCNAAWSRLNTGRDPWSPPAETLMLARPANHKRPTLHVPIHGFEAPVWMLLSAQAVSQPGRIEMAQGVVDGEQPAWPHQVHVRPAWSAPVPGHWLMVYRDATWQHGQADLEGLPRVLKNAALIRRAPTPGLGGDRLTEHLLAEVVPDPTFMEQAQVAGFAMVAEGMAPPPVIGDGKVGGVEIEGFEADPDAVAQAQANEPRREWPEVPEAEWLYRTDRSAWEQSSPEGVAIAARVLRRLGGIDRWARLSALSKDAASTLAPGQPPMGTTQSNDFLAGTMRLDINLPGGTQTMLLETDGAYIETQGRRAQFPADRARRMRLGEQTSLTRLLRDMAQEDRLGVHFEEPKLTVFDEMGEVCVLGLDEEGWVRSATSNDGENERFIEFRDYTEVQGLYFASSYVLRGAGGSESSTEVSTLRPTFEPGEDSADK